MIELLLHGPFAAGEMTLGFLQWLIPALIGGAATLGSAAIGKPDIPKQPSFGPSAYGAQNPAVMSMLQQLGAQQSADQQSNKSMQQQMLQQLLMSMLMQGMGGMFQGGQSDVQVGPVSPAVPYQDPLQSYKQRNGGFR